MKNNNTKSGCFGDGAGSYKLTKIPEAGLYEYIYKNDEILLKVDQYGVQTCQIDPPAGIASIKREKRETGSPVKTYFSVGKKLFNNFDIYKAKKFSINYMPEKAVYTLDFEEVEVVTELFVTNRGRRFIAATTLKNKSDKEKKIKILPCVYPYVNELMMAPWDKPEWYTRTRFSDDDVLVFTNERYIVKGKKEERRSFSMLTDLPLTSFELSEERLVFATKNFSKIPDKIGGKTEKELYAFGQCFSGLAKITVAPRSEYCFSNVFTVALYGENANKDIEESKIYLDKKKQDENQREAARKFKELFSVNTVKTKDKGFDKFVNGFLPLELDWVCSLDRGWPTGMRGVRDASNDFEGYLNYSAKKCREVIENIFSKQRSDGWYPRQVPFGGDKFDLRNFIDGACFFSEFVYEYLAITEDYGVLDEEYGYYDAPEVRENGFVHLKKGIEYLMQKENVGEHGLVKMQGGDWLDCLSGAGINGRGESVMVTCGLVMILRYLAEICLKRGENGDKYLNYAEKLKSTVNYVAYNDKGYYNAVFTDNGQWILSDNDPDGESRIYVPTNAYAVISGVAKGKEKNVIRNIETLKTRNGYKLFSVPFGKRQIDGIGKMGTGDFLPYFAENASVYNHGSQLFYLRALAMAKDYKKIYDVLNYAMPFNEKKHREKDGCIAPYAVTNCYHLVPSFFGRAGFSFLTGSVSMIERAVYNWIFGISFTLDNFEIKPCIPKEYADAEISMKFNGKTVRVKYSGYGNEIMSAWLNGEKISVEKAEIVLNKKEIKNLDTLEFKVQLNKKTASEV